MSKKRENNKQNINNVVLKCVLENGYYNMSLDIDDIKDVKVRLIVPNRKLACKIYHKINKQ